MPNCTKQGTVQLLICVASKHRTKSFLSITSKSKSGTPLFLVYKYIVLVYMHMYKYMYVYMYTSIYTIVPLAYLELIILQ